MTAIDLVGPKGYVHGWKYVGPPGGRGFMHKFEYRGGAGSVGHAAAIAQLGDKFQPRGELAAGSGTFSPFNDTIRNALRNTARSMTARDMRGANAHLDSAMKAARRIGPEAMAEIMAVRESLRDVPSYSRSGLSNPRYSGGPRGSQRHPSPLAYPPGYRPAASMSNEGSTMTYTDLAGQPKLGTGARFKALSGKLAARGARNPAALAAWIGRRKYGAKKFGALSHHSMANQPGGVELSARGDVMREFLGASGRPGQTEPGQRGPARPQRRPVPVTSPYDVHIARMQDGTARIVHRRSGDEIGTMARLSDGRWQSHLAAGDRDLVPLHQQRAVLLDLIAQHNTASRTELRPVPAQAPTPLMEQFGIPAAHAYSNDPGGISLATPAAGYSDGPRVASSGGSGDGVAGLSPKGATIYKRLRKKGFPHSRAATFARRAQSFGGK